MSNLDVKVTADTADLEARFQVASAKVRAFTSDVQALAKQSAAGTIDAAGQAQLQAFAGELVEAKAKAADLSSQLKESTTTSGGFGGALQEVRSALSTAFQVTGIALAYEGIQKLGGAIDQLGSRATEFESYSEILGVSVEQFQAMGGAAETAGTSSEVFARAAERLVTTLTEARQGSGAAVEKLLELGVTTEQIASPTFQLNDLLGELRTRLNDTQTAQSTMNALIAEFGPRAALAAEAIKAYDGSQAGVQAAMAQVNGLTTEQTQDLHELDTWWSNLGTATVNTASKALVAIHELLTGTSELERSMNTDVNAAPSAGPLSPQAYDAAQANADKIKTLNVQVSEVITQASLQALQEQIAGEAQGTAERLALVKEYYQESLVYYGSGQVDAVRKAYSQMEAEDRAYTSAVERNQEEIAQAQLQASNLAYELSQRQFSQNEALLEQEQQAAQQQLALEQQVTQEKYQLALEEFRDESQLLKEMQQQQSQTARQQVTAWQGAVNEIGSVESGLVSSLLTRRRSLAQSLKQESAELVAKEIADDLRAFTTRMLLGDTAAAQQKALEQGGLLYHAQAEALQTAQTATSQQAQTAAVITGNAARTAATQSGAAAAKAAGAAAGAQTVLADAAKAFSGTYASVSQIPYVGWILAPAAAAAAFTAVAAYQGIASLDVGTMNVPQDMVAMLHAGEAVLPRPFAQEYREQQSSGGASGGTASAGDTHNHTWNLSAVDPSSFSGLLGSSSGRNALAGAAIKYLSRGGRPRP